MNVGSEHSQSFCLLLDSNSWWMWWWNFAIACLFQLQLLKLFPNTDSVEKHSEVLRFASGLSENVGYFIGKHHGPQGIKIQITDVHTILVILRENEILSQDLFGILFQSNSSVETIVLKYADLNKAEIRSLFKAIKAGKLPQLKSWNCGTLWLATWMICLEDPTIQDSPVWRSWIWGMLIWTGRMWRVWVKLSGLGSCLNWRSWTWFPVTWATWRMRWRLWSLPVMLTVRSGCCSICMEVDWVGSSYRGAETSIAMCWPLMSVPVCTYSGTIKFTPRICSASCVKATHLLKQLSWNMPTWTKLRYGDFSKPSRLGSCLNWRSWNCLTLWLATWMICLEDPTIQDSPVWRSWIWARLIWTGRMWRV